MRCTAATPASTLEAMEVRWEERFSRLEKLVLSTTGLNKLVSKDDFDFGSETFSEGDGIKLFPSERAPRSRRRERFRHDRYLLEGEKKIEEKKSSSPHPWSSSLLSLQSTLPSHLELYLIHDLSAH